MAVTHRPRHRAAVAAAAGLSLVLAGCGAGSDGEATTGGEGAVERDFAIAVQSGPNSLDTADVVDGQQMFVWASVLDTLLARDRDTGELIPNAAESWEYNADGTVLTLALRDGMTFSDDSPVNAEAVVATMDRTRSTPGPVQAKFVKVDEVAALDDLTVEVRFSEHDPQFVWNLAMGAGAIGHPETIDDERSETDPIGSGPYTLDVENTVPGTTYVMNRRDDYWNASEIPADTFTVRVLPDPTASFNALQAGEIDGATVRAQMIDQLDASQFTISDVEASSLMVLDILDRAGDTVPALGDARVRQALNYAVNRDEIVSGLLAGAGSATEQIFNPGGPVYDEALAGTYDYDPDRAKELVEEAGYTGETIEIPSTFLSEAFEPTLSQAFEDAGLKAEWVPVPPQQAQSAHLSGDYGMSFQIVGANSTPADAFYHYGDGGFGNPTNYMDPTLDELFETINSTVDDEEAADEAYRELNEYAVEQAFEVPLVFSDQTWAARDGVTFSSVVGGVPMTIRAFDFEG